MKRILAILLLTLPLFATSAPFAMADDTTAATTADATSDSSSSDSSSSSSELNTTEEAIKDTSSFDVFDIFSIDEAHEGTTAADLEAEAAAKGTSPIGVLILRAINILMLLIGTFAFVMIIIGGVMFATAGGEESSIDRGKAILTQAIFGLVIAFMSYMIVAFIQSFFY